MGGAAPATCASHAFAYASAGPSLTSVHLSGTFNAWADPGLPLAYDGPSQTWQLSLELAGGNYAYKFVLDGKTWVADPNNPEQESDTFGGVNSLLTVVCP
jgi:1,4-alpha-glucan branching enzyme